MTYLVSETSLSTGVGWECDLGPDCKGPAGGRRLAVELCSIAVDILSGRENQMKTPIGRNVHIEENVKKIVEALLC